MTDWTGSAVPPQTLLLQRIVVGALTAWLVVGLAARVIGSTNDFRAGSAAGGLVIVAGFALVHRFKVRRTARVFLTVIGALLMLPLYLVGVFDW